MHAAGRSWDAAATSGLQVVSVAGVLGALIAVGAAGSPLVPFGALAICNVVSGTYAPVLCRRAPGLPPSLTLRSAAVQGKSLVAGSPAQYGAGFVVLAVVTAAAGPAAAALVEAVRLLAQPGAVAVVGVPAVLGPRIMHSALIGDAAAVRRLWGRCLLVAFALGAPYALVVSIPWDDNPLRLLVPRAFEEPYLLGAVVLVQAVGYAVGAYRAVPIVLGRAPLVLRVDVATAAIPSRWGSSSRPRCLGRRAGARSREHV